MRASTDGILTEERKETLARSMSTAVREGIKEAARGSSDSETEQTSGGRGILGTLVLVGLGAGIGYLVRWRRTMDGGDEGSDPMSESTIETTEESTGGRSRGRRFLSMLFRVGAVAALGYAMKRRSGSVGEDIDEASDRTRSVAEMTASRAGWAAQQIDAVTDQAADRIQQVGEETADRIQEGGEQTSEQIEEVAETTENVAEEVEGVEDEVPTSAEEVAETAGVTDEGGETDEGDESEGEASAEDGSEDDEE